MLPTKRLADSRADVDDGDPVELLSIGRGRTIKGRAPGGIVSTGMGVRWLLLPTETTLCRIESIKALALVARSFFFPKNMVLHMNNTQLLIVNK